MTWVRRPVGPKTLEQDVCSGLLLRFLSTLDKGLDPSPLSPGVPVLVSLIVPTPNRVPDLSIVNDDTLEFRHLLAGTRGGKGVDV